jgi:molybdopterin molybdotransferase
MIRYQDALGIMKKHAALFDIEEVNLIDSVGRVAATAYSSDKMIPSFRNAAMDGFAVSHKDIPDHLEMLVKASIAAGDNKQITDTKCAYEITTGAMVPDICNTVIPVEDVMILETLESSPKRIRLKRKPSLDENIRSPGEDFNPGALLLNKGEVITPENIIALAAHGITTVRTYRVQPIHIIATGNEITDITDKNIGAGKIYNSNAPYLMASCKALGLQYIYHGIIADDLSALKAVLDRIPSHAIIITTGAVSMGRWDLIPEAIKATDGIIHFHKVQIRPGKPILFASLPNHRCLFGLPGNPISTIIGFRFFVTSFLRFGLELGIETPLSATLTKPYAKKNKMKQFLKSSYHQNCVSPTVDILDGQESFKIRPLLEGNAWAILEEEQSNTKAGEILSIYPFEASFSDTALDHLTKEKAYEQAA